MEILFLLPVLSEARCHKRIRELKKFGVSPKILAFERYYFKGKTITDWNQSLGTLQHGKYYKRLIPLLKSIFKIRSVVKVTNVVYAFGLDMLLLGWVATFGLRKPIKLIYEVADIHFMLTRGGVTSRFLQWLERFLLKRISLLVVTSDTYVTGYYQNILGVKDLRYTVIENKIEDIKSIKQKDSNLQRASFLPDILRIGYFGVLRCRRTWHILKKIAEDGEGRVQIYIRGIPIGLENFEREAKETPNMEYGGPYVSPDDLPGIYEQVDLIWACYTYQGSKIGNWCWARTNRFYESCFMKKPMLTQLGSEDGRVVEKLDLGMCVDLGVVEKTVTQVLNITKGDLDRWQENLAKLPEEVYMYTNEHEILFQMMLQER